MRRHWPLFLSVRPGALPCWLAGLLLLALLLAAEGVAADEPEPGLWVHTTQADWMRGERDHLDVRGLDAMGQPLGFDQDQRGSIRLRSQPGPWTPHPSSPVVVPGAESSWDDATISEAKVVFDGQTFHMWYAGRKRGPPGLKMPMDLGYAASPDGVRWTKWADNPVLIRGPQGSYDENMITAPYVLYDGDQFHMWFSAVDFQGDWSINAARSPDGVHWTKDPSNPLLQETHDYRWDAVYIAEPCVLYNGSGFEMWYNGASATTETLVGYATSPDGFRWTRFQENRPVLTVASDGTWDDFAVARVAVIYDGEQYKMWYEGHNGASWRIGYALSVDGIHWERANKDPIVDLGPQDAWNSKVSSEPYVLFDGQTYWLWHSGYDGDLYRVGLVTAPAEYAERGVFVSFPIEAAQPVEWGTLTVDLSLPTGTAVGLSIAASEDGVGWTDWTPAPSTLVSGANRIDLTLLELAPGRYLRYRAELTTSDRAVSPQIHEVVAAEAVPDWTLSAGDDELAVQSGQSVKTSISVEPVRGFSDPVLLAVAGAPPGVEVTWTPGEVTPPSEAALTLAARPDAAPGAYTLEVVARSGALEHRQSLLLTIFAPTPTVTPMPTPTATASATPEAAPTAAAMTPPTTPAPTLAPSATPIPPAAPLPPASPWLLWLGIAMIAVGALGLAGWAIARRSGRRRIWSPSSRWHSPLWGLLLTLIALVGLVVAWCDVSARQRAEQGLAQATSPAAHVTGTGAGPSPTPSPSPTPRVGKLVVAGIDAGGLTAAQLEAAIEAQAVAPLRRTIQVRCLDHVAELDTTELGLQTNRSEIVAQAVRLSASESGDAASGELLLHNPGPDDVRLPLTFTIEMDLMVAWVDQLAAEVSSPVVEHTFDPQTLTFRSGREGVALDTAQAVERIRDSVFDPSIDRVELSATTLFPQTWSEDELRLTLSRAQEIWTRPPVAPSSQAVTLTFDYARWIGPDSPAADWQPTRTMTSVQFHPGQMGWTLDLSRAEERIRAALDEGAPQVAARVFTDVAPAPLTLTDVKPLLLDIAAHFDGHTGFYVQDLSSGQEIGHQTHVTTSGMSMIKVAIMATAYRSITRPFSTELEKAMQEMVAYSINEQSNAVLRAIGGGDLARGLEQVNQTLQGLDLRQTYIRSGYRTEEGAPGETIPIPERAAASIPVDERLDLWPDTAMQTSLADQVTLFRALYQGAQGSGPLLAAFPELSAQDCQEMLDRLKTNPTRVLLGAGFPQEAPLAHKHGYGGGAYTDERMDVGIVWPPDGRPYLAGLYQWDQTGWIHWLRVWPQQIELSTALYNYFTAPTPLPAEDKPG